MTGVSAMNEEVITEEAITEEKSAGTEEAITVGQDPQMSIEEFSKMIGGNGIYFLNKPGTAPALTDETMQEFQAWQDLCKVMLNIKNGKIMLVPGKHES